MAISGTVIAHSIESLLSSFALLCRFFVDVLCLIRLSYLLGCGGVWTQTALYTHLPPSSTPSLTLRPPALSDNPILPCVEFYSPFMTTPITAGHVWLLTLPVGRVTFCLLLLLSPVTVQTTW